MMARIDMILVVALASVLVAQSCNAAFDLSSLDKYLDLPDEHLFGTVEQFNKNIREAMLQLNHVGSATNFDTVLGQIKQLAKSKSEHQETYECLDILCGYEKRNLPYSCVYNIKSIVTQVTPNGEIGRFKTLLDMCTKNYFYTLVKTTTNDIANGGNRAKLLDQLFKGAFEYDSKIKEQPNLDKDVFLVEQLKGFNLATGKMNVRKMVDAAKGLYKPSKPSSKLSLRPLIIGMNQACVELQFNRYVLDVIILFKAIKNEELKLNKLEKLLEYQRICMDWQNTNMRDQILANMNKL